MRNLQTNEMTVVLGQDSALKGCTGTTWTTENFVINNDPGAGSIAQPVDQQSSMLLLCYGRHPVMFRTYKSSN